MLFCSFGFEWSNTPFNFLARYVRVDWCGQMSGTWQAHMIHCTLHAFSEYRMKPDQTPSPTTRHMHSLVEVQILYYFKRIWMQRQKSWGHSRRKWKPWRQQARWFPPVALGHRGSESQAQCGGGGKTMWQHAFAGIMNREAPPYGELVLACLKNAWSTYDKCVIIAWLMQA